MLVIWECQTLPSRRGESDLSEQQQAIRELLDQSDRALALREIRSELGPETNERHLREDLAILKARGLAKATGHEPGSTLETLVRLWVGSIRLIPTHSGSFSTSESRL